VRWSGLAAAFSIVSSRMSTRCCEVPLLMRSGRKWKGQRARGDAKRRGFNHRHLFMSWTVQVRAFTLSLFLGLDDCFLQVSIVDHLFCSMGDDSCIFYTEISEYILMHMAYDSLTARLS
jgi:hypothetical protein